MRRCGDALLSSIVVLAQARIHPNKNPMGPRLREGDDILVTSRNGVRWRHHFITSLARNLCAACAVSTWQRVLRMKWSS